MAINGVIITNPHNPNVKSLKVIMSVKIEINSNQKKTFKETLKNIMKLGPVNTNN